MDRVTQEVLMNQKDKASNDRPAWTGTTATGGLTNAFNHKHTVERTRHGMKFKLVRNFFNKGKS